MKLSLLTFLVFVCVLALGQPNISELTFASKEATSLSGKFQKDYDIDNKGFTTDLGINFVFGSSTASTPKTIYYDKSDMEKGGVENSQLSKLNLYLELGTNVAISSASANLEVHIANAKTGKINWYGRAGFGGAGVLFGNAGLGGLGAITMLTGKGKNHFEASGGVFIGHDSYYGDTFTLPLLDLGYRFQKPGGGFVFRGKAGTLGVGIGIGYSF